MTTTSRFTSSKTSASAAAPKARRTATSKAVDQAVNKPSAEHVQAESAYEAYVRRTAAARDEFMASQNVPTATRVVVATIANLLSLSVTLYWGIEASTALMAAAFLLTSSVFITWVIGFMGLVLSLYAAMQTGSAIGDFVLGFNYERTAAIGRDLRVAAAKRVNLVRGWFTKSTPEEVIA